MKSIYFMLFLLFVSARRRHHHVKHRNRTNRGNYYKKVRSISKILSNDYFCQSIFHDFDTRRFFRLVTCCWWIGKLTINCQVKMLADKVIIILNPIFTGISTGMKPNVNFWFRFRNIQNRMRKWVIFVFVLFAIRINSD